MTKITVGGRDLGPGRPALLVAEIGGNHGGDPGLAGRMVTAAAEAGAGAVKFQAYRTAEFLSRLSPYYDELAAEELPFADLADLLRQAHSQGLAAGLTVFDQAGLELAREAGADFIKISSGDLTHHDLLALAAEAGPPLFVSTGAATAGEIAEALPVLTPARDRLVLLQCASLYPAPPEAANLGVMAAWLAEGRAAGYSDHVPGLEAAALALALGAWVVEKHFTTDRGLPGGDNALSALPEDFTRLSRWNTLIPVLRGQTDKSPHPREEPVRALIRRVVVAARDLPAGRLLTPDDLALKRAPAAPGLVDPREQDRLVGLPLRKNVSRDEAIRRADAADRF